MASINPNYICPITGEIMIRPVIACDQGHIFDERAITEWQRGDHHAHRPPQDTCPTCRAHLLPHFILNRSLFEEIQVYRAANPAPIPQNPTPPFKDGAVFCSADILEESGKTFLHVQATTEPTGPRQGTVYILGLDNSGSMAELADPDSKESLFTRMDLIYHTVNTAAAMMTDDDSMAIVSFSATAKTVMEPTQMNATGKAKLIQRLKTVQPDGMTNIEAAVREMMAIANRPEMAGRNIVAALLTDGAETVKPSPSGTVSALSRIPMRNQWNFSTFGLGYSLDSGLLMKLAEMGGGIFGFIPDVSMVGTVFINFIATAAASGCRNAELSIKVNGTESKMNTGLLSIGHPRDFFFPILPGSAIQVSANGGDPVVPTTTASDFVKTRKLYMDLLQMAIQFSEARKTEIAADTLMTLESKMAASACPQTKAFLLDVKSDDSSEGQIGMAPHYWSRWGSHYSRSYLRTVLQRGCRLNFKDPGSLLHGKHPLFEAVVADGENTQAYMTSASQAAYSGGCFAGHVRIMTWDPLAQVYYRKPISEIRPGDFVWTMQGKAKVEVFVTCGSKNSHQMMSKVQGKDGVCLLTPYHPYMNIQDGTWVTGRDTVGDEAMTISTVYNLVLDKGHIIDMEGVFCCTLAHGIHGKVIGHEFFGTGAVLEAMKRQTGFPCPVYKNLEVRRDPVSGLINDWYDDI
jgi:Hint-domain/von Willebrand factor type A domain/U-box domain